MVRSHNIDDRRDMEKEKEGFVAVMVLRNAWTFFPYAIKSGGGLRPGTNGRREGSLPECGG
jgi:hypothetical protein